MPLTRTLPSFSRFVSAPKQLQIVIQFHTKLFFSWSENHFWSETNFPIDSIKFLNSWNKVPFIAAHILQSVSLTLPTINTQTHSYITNWHILRVAEILIKSANAKQFLDAPRLSLDSRENSSEAIWVAASYSIILTPLAVSVFEENLNWNNFTWHANDLNPSASLMN